MSEDKDALIYLADVRIEELEAENAKLLDEKIDAYNAKVEAQLEADELRAENARLWGVVEAILQCAVEIKRDKGCDACPMFNADGNFLVRDSWCRLYPTLRELGVEV